jgi:LacI family transcriptional regulator
MAENRITITDIARELNITASTVSRALAGNTRISEATRDMVQAKARDMGYEPNAIAASLRKGKSDTIGMIVPRINRHFFSSVISGVEEILNPAGYNLVICQTQENYEKERKAVQTLLRNQVGCIILSLSVQTRDFKHLEEVIKRNIGLIQFDRVNKQLPGAKIVNDNFSGAYLAVKHLIKGGYQRIAHYSGDLNLLAYQERLEGYKYALEEAEMEYDPDLVFENAITRDAGYSFIEKAKMERRADALFSAGDYSALGAIDKLKEMQLIVPKDFGVVGFANEPFSEIMEPSLSSVEQNTQEIGNRIAAAVMKTLSKPLEEHSIETVPVRLIVRQSSWQANEQSIK